jgi:endonuclease-3 related protein
MPHEDLAELIRPAGYFNVKAGRLKNFIAWLMDYCDGRTESLKSQSLYDLREALLNVNGIGAETADSILLYACQKPVFVVDAYTARIFGRHGLLEPDMGYEDIRDMFESHLPKEIALYNEYHALIVRLGKEYCRPKARCQGCPLEDLSHDLHPF